MKVKQVSVQLEQVRHTVKSQRFTKQPGDVGDGPWTTQINLPVTYHVTGMRNAVVLNFHSLGPNDLKSLRVGDVLNEAQAQELASMRDLEVTVKS